MAFDKSTRSRLKDFVTDARGVLSDEFTRQMQATYGLDPNTGSVADISSLTHLDNRQRETAQLLRETFAHYVASLSSGTEKARTKQALERMVREQAFTVLNRLAALRMAEARGFLLESVAKGYTSKGFQLYKQLTGGALGETGDAYSSYLLSLFDEFTIDLAVLFDRHSTQSLLFPREPALLALLELLNGPDIEALWAEDETIGWIYQYYNDPDERKKMRKESAAPRNSRELAIRNQFFTPRYVVEFLTDNTLGRIWHEMTKGDTRLAEQCRYLVRRPTEVFLDEDKEAPELPETDTKENLSQEELLKQPVQIPHRPVKDPREIRLLDPACGSMHFGLYAFDLFEVIYEEAWDKGLCPALEEAYSEKVEYLREVPRLIIEHNIHGVDIDSRAVQIAGLSLWLRAQKSWKDTPAAERPRIRRSNIVCAEPMPGSDAMLEDFAQTLDPPLLGELVNAVFDKMQLAGEAGTLLKIEEEIRTAIDAARQAWDKLQRKSPGLFSIAELNRVSTQPELSSIDTAVRAPSSQVSSDFFDTAEERIYAALHDYAESAEAGGYQRRLFAEDAAHGFAFIDLCRERYDVILMNPPFGSPAGALADYSDSYPHSGRDIYGMFVERTDALRSPGGMLGAIMPRTGLFIGTMEELRREYYCRKAPLKLLFDLGKGVLDDATIRTACYVFGSAPDRVACARIGNIEAREERVSQVIEALNSSIADQDLFIRRMGYFDKLPGSAIAYWIPQNLAAKIPSLPRLEEHLDIRQGIATGDNFRFLRMLCELPDGKPGYQSYSKGGEPVPFISDETLYVRSHQDACEMKANAAQQYGSASRTIKNEDTFGRPGLTYSQVNDAGLKFRAHPSDSIYDMKGPVLFSRDEEPVDALLGFLNSSAVEDFMRMMTDGRQWHVSALKRVPIPNFQSEDLTRLIDVSRIGCTIARERFILDETSHFFPYCWDYEFSSIGERLEELSDEVDSIVWRSYGATDLELESFARQRALFLERSVDQDGDEEIDPNYPISTALGSIFGRWDIRYATGERQPPELPAPFDPLPVCPPGMLQNDNGLPASPDDVPGDYPLDITWPGILVDDDGHPEDIVARIRDALVVTWGDRGASIEQEACEILSVRSLRDYFAEKKSGGRFFKDHLKRYSKSRRQAPIYWPLSTKSGSYTLWIYYHRLTEQTLYTCVNDFVEPKLQSVTNDLAAMRSKLTRTAQEENEFARLVDSEGELKDLREELLRVAKYWKPNLNDGVQITAAPLWSLFRLKKWQKTLHDTWKKLEKGDYDWAHLACSVWPERVLRKCHEDRSLAIAHGVEEDFWAETEVPVMRGKKATGKTKLEWRPKSFSTDELDRLIQSKFVEMKT